MKGTKLAKTEGLKPFWARLFDAYWKKFPCDLPLDQEPAQEVPSLDKNAQATAATMMTKMEEQDTEEQDTEESDRKEKVMKDTKDVRARSDTIHWPRH
jgi:hypothetical protein